MFNPFTNRSRFLAVLSRTIKATNIESSSTVVRADRNYKKYRKLKNKISSNSKLYNRTHSRNQ